MSPPRKIEGTIGSRIRVIFGATGEEWLLLLNHDDGSTTWQSQNWKGIPNGLGKQIKNCLVKGRSVREVDFGPDNAWYVNGIKRDGTGGHSWWDGVNEELSSHFKENCGTSAYKPSIGLRDGWTSVCHVTGDNGYQCTNIDDDLAKRMKRINRRKKKIHFVRLFDDGAYFIKDEEGTEWKNVGPHCSKELKSNRSVEDLAVASDGSWIVIGPDAYVSSHGTDNELTKEIGTFFNQQRQRMRQRDRDIKAYHDRIRAEQEAAERVAREEAERIEREAAERAEQERAAREEAEGIEREAAERAEQESREEAERLEAEAIKRAREQSQQEAVTKLEIKLETQLAEEKKNIQELQEELGHMQAHLQARKRSLRTSISSLPAERRRRLEIDEDDDTAGSRKVEEKHCVICQDQCPVIAVIPCGHLCLCDDCGTSLLSGPAEARFCPLCRVPMVSTLKIFS